MKVTKDNLDIIEDKDERNLVKLLLEELEAGINSRLSDHQKIYITYDLEHTDYSPEWTEPMPDFYHTYAICSDALDYTLADGLRIHELDSAICCLDSLHDVMNND